MRRLILFDNLNLRDSSVYRSPRDISVLKLAFGDLTAVRIPCTPLDEAGRIHHISDRQIMSINNVYVDGEPRTSGFRAFTSYQDETGSPIACVIFDNPQYDKRVTVSCKGIISLKNGALIENPADLIEYVLLNVQNYDEGSVNAGTLAKFRADCLKEGITVAFLMDQVIKIREWLDELALNIQSRWALSDGKSVMRLKWL